MISFLRLFAAFRNLEAQLTESGSRVVFLEGQVRWLQGQVEKRDEDVNAAIAEKDHANHCVADFLSQQLTGRKIYAPAPDLPEKTAPPPVAVPARPHGRDYVAQRTADTVQQLNDFYTPHDAA